MAGSVLLAPEYNLLLGLVAMQEGFINYEQWQTSLHDWLEDSSRPQLSLLVGRGALTVEQQRQVEQIAEVYRQRWEGDLLRCLAELYWPKEVRVHLESLPHSEI